MINRDGTKGIRHFTEYESVDELLNSVQLHEKNRFHRESVIFGKNDIMHPSRDVHRNWRGGMSTIDELKHFVHLGWKDGLKRMKDVVVQIKDIPGIKDIRRIGEWADQGDDLNIDRIYSGDCDRAWRRSKRVLREGASRHGRIFVNISTSAAVHPEDFFWRGAAACAAADILEDAGYRVEIAGFNMTRGTWNDSAALDSVVIVYLKKFDEALDVERLAACTAHASFYRIGVFAHELSQPSYASMGLGRPLVGPHPLSGENDVTVDSVFCLEAALQCVRFIIANITGKAFESN